MQVSHSPVHQRNIRLSCLRTRVTEIRLARSPMIQCRRSSTIGRARKAASRRVSDTAVGRQRPQFLRKLSLIFFKDFFKANFDLLSLERANEVDAREEVLDCPMHLLRDIPIRKRRILNVLFERLTKTFVRARLVRPCQDEDDVAREHQEQSRRSGHSERHVDDAAGKEQRCASEQNASADPDDGQAFGEDHGEAMLQVVPHDALHDLLYRYGSHSRRAEAGDDGFADENRDRYPVRRRGQGHEGGTSGAADDAPVETHRLGAC